LSNTHPIRIRLQREDALATSEPLDDVSKIRIPVLLHDAHGFEIREVRWLGVEPRSNDPASLGYVLPDSDPDSFSPKEPLASLVIVV
jgi:hypothetical protein